jgi:hypothetical protein
MPLRPEFLEALDLFAKATDRMAGKGMSAPVLVGGAAVELYTGGAVVSGDFDFVSEWQAEFFAELMALGFERPTQAGWLQSSLLHPALDIAVQVVSKPLMDGRTDSDRILILDLTRESGKPLPLRIIPAEDLIADRMAQALAGPRLDKNMQNQAIRLYQLVEDVDEAYLDGRIRTETGNQASVETLRAWMNDADDHDSRA